MREFDHCRASYRKHVRGWIGVKTNFGHDANRRKSDYRSQSNCSDGEARVIGTGAKMGLPGAYTLTWSSNAARSRTSTCFQRPIPIYGSTCFFRDYLRTHPETAMQYERLKRSLASQQGMDRRSYTDAKSDFINQIIGTATGSVKHSDVESKE